MIVVRQGDEYEGETYVSCDAHGWPEPKFKGWSLAELQSFITEHEGHVNA